jgi:uncharacterized protein YhfF
MTSDDRRSGLTRRSLLGVGSASILGAVTATAGCLSALPPLGQSVKYGRLDVPAADPPGYREWLPDPELIGQDRGDVQMHQVQPGAWVAADPRPFAFNSVVVSQLDYLGIGYGTYERAIWYGTEVVVLADFDPESVAETLLDSGFERAGSTDRYHLFSRADRDRAVAVGSGFVITSQSDEPRRNVGAILDARAGDVDRFHEVDEEFARLSGNAGDRLWTWRLGGNVAERDFDGDVTEHVVSSTADDRVYFVMQYLLAEGTTPSKSAIKRVLEDGDRAPSAQMTDIDIDGREVTIEYHDPDEEYRSEGDDPLAALPPHVTWGFDDDRETTTVTIRHEAGDEFDAGTVTVDVDGDPAAEQFADRFDRVGPGDELEVSVDATSQFSDGRVSVVWERPDGDVTSLLANYEVEEER